MNKLELKKVMGENLRKARELHRLTTVELAAQMEITPGYLGLIERGKRGLTACMIFKVCKLFSMSVDSFFEDGARKEKNAGGSSSNDGLVCFMPILVYPRRYMDELKEEIERLKQDAAVNENLAFKFLADAFSQIKGEPAEPYGDADDYEEDEE